MRPGRSSLGLLLAAAAGCAGARLQDGLYRDGDLAYRTGALGAEWRPLEIHGGQVGLRHVEGGTILANGSCADGTDAPLDVLINQALFGFEDKQEQGRSTFTLDGRAARRARIDATLDGVPIAVDLVVLKKDRCVYDLQLVASPATAALRRKDFERFIAGFAVLRGGP